MQFKNSKYNNLVFLCGARDFHAMDWYRRSLDQISNVNIYILTDLIEGEKYKKLINSKDKVFKLIILDNFLLRDQSSFGHFWRRLIKIIVFPFQILLIKKFEKDYPNSIFYAHAMYYIWLAKFAGVKFVGRPQGNDILTNPFKSKVYKFLSISSMKSAKAIIVDSFLMAESIKKITSNVKIKVITNGIDLSLIQKIRDTQDKSERKNIISIRGFNDNYRIKEILASRSFSKETSSIPIHLIYPFYDKTYKNDLKDLLIASDIDVSRLDKKNLYQTLFKCKLVISIPRNDSSPRSVYEAIFCGCIVAIAYNSYYEFLPSSIKSRVIIVDINKKDWFYHAINKAEYLINKPFKPCSKALQVFDQDRTFKEMAGVLLN